MRRFASPFTTVTFAVCIALSISLFVLPQTASVAHEKDHKPFSQGSLYKGAGPHPEARHDSGYSQVVRGKTSGRLSGLLGRFGGPGVETFEPDIPKNGRYSLYARWQAGPKPGGKVRFGIGTGNGMQWKRLRLHGKGGKWVEVGTYKLEPGQRRIMQTSPPRFGGGPGTARAVKVVAEHEKPVGLVTDEAPPSEEYKTFSTATTQADKRRLAVRRARNHIGTRYRLSPPAPCRAFRVEDCSCHTKLVFNRWRRLPDSPVKQWRYGRRVHKRANVRPGDLVFFKERGRNRPITHVGIYSGRGNLIHASSYYGKVVESKMKYIRGYYGAKRLGL